MELCFNIKSKIFDYLDLYSSLTLAKPKGYFKEFNSNIQFKLGLLLSDF